MTFTEPEWDDDDRALMHGLALVEADECPGCHGSLAETTSLEADDAYVAKPTRCHVCSAIAAAQDRIDKETPTPRGLLWRAERRH